MEHLCTGLTSFTWVWQTCQHLQEIVNGHMKWRLSSPNHCTATKVHHQVLRSCQHPHEQGVEESVCVRVCPSVRARTHTQQQQWSTREGVLLYCLHNTGLEGVLLYCLHNTGLEGVLLYCLHNTGLEGVLLYCLHNTGLEGVLFYCLHNTGLEEVVLYTSSTTQGWGLACCEAGIGELPLLMPEQLKRPHFTAQHTNCRPNMKI